MKTSESKHVGTGGSFASPNDAASGFTLGRTPHIDALGSGGLHEGVACVVLAKSTAFVKWRLPNLVVPENGWL